MSTTTNKTISVIFLVLSVALLALDVYAWTIGASTITRVMLPVAASMCALVTVRLNLSA